MSEPSVAWISIEPSGVSVRLRAVDVRAEHDAVFGQLRQLRQAEDLEAARVGEHRALPAHEAVQAAVRGDHLEAGAQPQVIGVAEDDARADAFELARGHRP